MHLISFSDTNEWTLVQVNPLWRCMWCTERVIMMKKQLTRTLVLLILHICHHISTVTAGIWETNGTTPNIKEIIIGRCWQYQAIVKLNRLDSLTMDVNCTEVWEAFHNVVKFKDSCTLTKEDYMPVFDLMQRKKKLKDKVSGVFYSPLDQIFL